MSPKKNRFNLSDRMTVSGNYNLNGELDAGPECAVLQYLERMLASYELTEKIIELAVSLLSVERRKRLVGFLFKPGSGKRPSGGVFDDALADVCSPDLLVRDIVAGITSGEVAHDEKGIRFYLKELVAEQIEERSGKSVIEFSMRVGEVARLFNLNQVEIDVLEFLFCLYYGRIESFNYMENKLTLPDFIALVSIATGYSPIAVKKALGHTGSLFRSGIITEINLNSHSSFYDLSDSIVEYLAGICDRKLVLQFLRSDEEETYDLASFTSIHPARIALIRDILASSNPSNILLYGKAGTGKTEFARALVAAVGKQISFLEYWCCNYSFSQAVDPSRRMVALCGAVNAVSPLNGVIIVDEADNLLNTMNLFLSAKDSVEKGQLNGFIDNPKAHIIWIANDVRWVEESTMRRFSYSLYFREYSSREREIIWHNVLKGHPLKKFVTAKMIKEMSDDFNVNAGGVAKAIRAAESILASRRPTRGVVRSLLREILERHEELIHGSFRERKMKPLHSLTEQYDVSALNTDMDPGLVRKAVVSFASRIQKNAFPENRNMNLLFWGQAGTGKTEFAKFVARESGLKLIVKRYSDLESKWVGETEKNIAGGFREAEAEQAILFVDEADSFFTARDNALRSWEVSRTNEFLTQMENHQGIFICCTNLLPSMDRAAMRRFQWKIEFRALKDEAKLKLFMNYFCPKGQQLDESDARSVEEIADLTPGDIKAVWQRYNGLLGNSVTIKSIIRELEKEVLYRRGGGIVKVGFN